MSNFVRPQRRQPTRLPRPWDSPGKNTGVGCHFLLQCIKVKNERMIFVRFQGKPFSITVIQVYAPTSYTEEGEVEHFYEDL